MKKGTLLIIDDEPDILDGLKLALEDLVDFVVLSSDAHHALEILENIDVNCIISDINMPGMSGVDFLKSIRSRGNNLPFIFFTGHGNKKLMIEAAKYDVFDFLDKPHFDRLEEVVTRGIEESFVRKKPSQFHPNQYVSEYLQLLDEMEKED